MPVKTCFVIAPIGDPESAIRKRSDDILKAVIEPAALECGYDAVRADKISAPGMITSQVIQHIIDDPLAIADLTGPNANVFYELAVRHAFKKPVIQIIERGEKIPFDVAGLRTIEFDSKDIGSGADCKKEIVNQIHAIEKEPDKVENPISSTVDIQSLRSGNALEKTTAEIRSLLSYLNITLNSRFDAMTALVRKEFLATAAKSPFGQFKISFKMTTAIDPFTGSDRPDLPRSDVIGYLPSNEVNGLASGTYDVYVSAPGYPELLIASGLKIVRQLKPWEPPTMTPPTIAEAPAAAPAPAPTHF